MEHKGTNGAPQIVPHGPPEPKWAGEYTLTPDERAMVDAMATAHQAAYQAELNAVLGAIIRFRKLGEGAWNLVDGKLTRTT